MLEVDRSNVKVKDAKMPVTPTHTVRFISSTVHNVHFPEAGMLAVLCTAHFLDMYAKNSFSVTLTVNAVNSTSQLRLFYTILRRSHWTAEKANKMSKNDKFQRVG